LKKFEKVFQVAPLLNASKKISNLEFKYPLLDLQEKVYQILGKIFLDFSIVAGFILRRN
jgi:hypothetical protein